MGGQASWCTAAVETADAAEHMLTLTHPHSSPEKQALLSLCTEDGTDDQRESQATQSHTAKKKKKKKAALGMQHRII